MPGRRSIARPPSPKGPAPGPAATPLCPHPPRLRQRPNGEAPELWNGRPARGGAGALCVHCRARYVRAMKRKRRR